MSSKKNRNRNQSRPQTSQGNQSGPSGARPAPAEPPAPPAAQLVNDALSAAAEEGLDVNTVEPADTATVSDVDLRLAAGLYAAAEIGRAHV